MCQLLPHHTQCDQIELESMQKRSADFVALAKAKWYVHQCNKIHDMNMNPKQVLESIQILTDGELAHHKKTISMAMKLAGGKLAANGKENIQLLLSTCTTYLAYFQKVYNDHLQIDDDLINLIK